jgi:hypothetical protein
MVTGLPGWLERSLVLGHAEPDRNTTAERFASGSTAASRFIGNFRKRIELLIHSRRAGRNPTSELPASDAAWCFGASANDFQRDCGAWCHEVGPSVRGLSMTIVWALLHLMPDPRNWPGITGMALVNTAVGAAGRLAKRHHQTLASVSRADTHRKMLPLAQKVVDKIALKQPVSERDLMRSFDHQRKATYLPVLTALADADVILRTPDNFLRLGTRRLDEVEGFR